MPSTNDQAARRGRGRRATSTPAGRPSASTAPPTPWTSPAGVGASPTTVPVPGNGVLYVDNAAPARADPPIVANYAEPTACGNLYVSGDYATSMTFGAANDIIVRPPANSANGDAIKARRRRGARADRQQLRARLPPRQPRQQRQLPGQLRQPALGAADARRDDRGRDPLAAALVHGRQLQLRLAARGPHGSPARSRRSTAGRSAPAAGGRPSTRATTSSTRTTTACATAARRSSSARSTRRGPSSAATSRCRRAERRHPPPPQVSPRSRARRSGGPSSSRVMGWRPAPRPAARSGRATRGRSARSAGRPGRRCRAPGPRP